MDWFHWHDWPNFAQNKIFIGCWCSREGFYSKPLETNYFVDHFKFYTCLHTVFTFLPCTIVYTQFPLFSFPPLPSQSFHFSLFNYCFSQFSFFSFSPLSSQNFHFSLVYHCQHTCFIFLPYTIASTNFSLFSLSP